MNTPRQSLARKWRPQSFAELCGHDYAVRAVQNAVHRHHAFLFTGTRGVGKTTLARIIAKTLNCTNSKDGEPCLQCDLCTQIANGSLLDVVELDAASHTQVDKMRELLESANYPPMHSQYKVFIIDEAHMLSKAAFASMLKTLEEPPDYLKFVLATTDPQRMPATILSRCLCFHLRPLERAQISERLATILQKENQEYEEAAVREIARQARGSMRDALSIAEQAMAHSEGKLQVAAVRRISGEADVECIVDILTAVAAADHATLTETARRLAADGAGLDSVLSRLAAFIYKTALAKIAPKAAAEDDDEKQAIDKVAQLFNDETLQVLYEIAVRGRKQLPWAPDEQTGFEMTLLRMTLFSPNASDANANASDASNASNASHHSDANVGASNASTSHASQTQVHSNGINHAVNKRADNIANGTSMANGAMNGATSNAHGEQSVIPTSASGWKQAILQLKPTSQALVKRCTLKEINSDGAVLILDKSVAGNTAYLAELRKEMQVIFHPNFTITLTEGTNDAAADAQTEILTQKAKSVPFIRDILNNMPEARLVAGSIELTNKENP